MSNFKNKMLTLMLVTGIFLFASFNSGYATEIWENYTMTVAINAETCCLDITFTNTNTTEQLFFDIHELQEGPTLQTDRVVVDAGATITFSICPSTDDTEIQWFAEVGQTSLGNNIIEIITDGYQFADIADVCGDCPGEYFSIVCNLTYGSSSIIEITPCCSLRVNYCYCENKYNEKFMYITNMALIQNCGLFGECDATKNQIMMDPTYYLNKAWKQIAFDEIPEWNLTLKHCDDIDPNDIIYRLGFAACWSDEWHEVLVLIPGDGQFGGIPDMYETRWVMKPCDVEVSEGTTCTIAYSVCWKFINGEMVIVETIEDYYSPNIDCGDDCNYVCE